MKRRTFEVDDFPDTEKAPKKAKLKYTKKEDRVSATLNLDLEKAVGRRMISATQLAGYVCKICNLVYSDSHSYLEHLNSRMHQISAGISDIPDKVSLQQVLDRIEYWKNQKPESETVEAIKKRVEQNKSDSKNRRKSQK